MIDSTFKWKSWMIVNSLGVVYIVVHLEKKGKNKKKKKIKEKNIRSPGMCRLLVRHPCRSCHDRRPSHTLLLPMLVIAWYTKWWVRVNCDQGPVFEFLLETRNKHCQYYRSKKTQTCLLQGCWAPRGHNGLRLGSTCASIRVSNKTWEDGKMARWQDGKMARCRGPKTWVAGSFCALGKFLHVC